MIKRNDAEMFGKRVEGGEPIEVGGCSPTVKQEQRWCTGWAVQFAHECLAASGEVDESTRGQCHGLLG
jgi:hypothetical protein